MGVRERLTNNHPPIRFVAHTPEVIHCSMKACIRLDAVPRFIRLGCDASTATMRPACHWLHDCRRIVVNAGRLGEQEYFLRGARRSVSHTLWHRRGLAPCDLRTQPPTILLQREGETPRHANSVLCLEASEPLATPHCCAVQRLHVFAARRAAPFRVVSVSVAHVYPARPVGPEHAPHFSKHLNHPREIFRRRALQAQLPWHAIIP